MKKRKIAGIIAAGMVGLLALTGCVRAADQASYNLSEKADNFEINRRITFVNGITGDFFLTIEGFCSIVDDAGQLEVTCRVGPDEYTKDFLGLSDNISYMSEQIDAADVSIYHRLVLIRPETILPEVQLDTGRQ